MLEFSPSSRPAKLFRYSSRERLTRSLKLGEFRLAPATMYKDLEDDLARQDNELIKEKTVPAHQAKVSVSSTGKPLKVVEDLRVTDEFMTNYYLLCFSTRFKDHLFDDFGGSDACLIIHDVEEVGNRILHSASRILKGWAGLDDAVTYGGEHAWGAMFIKDVRHIFQHEWRFAWMPPKAVQDLASFNIQIGNIEKFAEIVSRPKRDIINGA